MGQSNAGRRFADPEAKASPVDRLFAAQRAALDELIAGIDGDARWVLLVGPDGSGKSTVVEALLDELRRVAATVAVFEAPKTPDVAQLAGRLRDQLGLPRTRKFLGDEYSVSDIVASQAALRTPLVVVVDDADALMSASVKWLANLAKTASRTEIPCYVVLVGTSKIEELAGTAWAKSGSSRASVLCVLEPMTSAEIRRYVEEWRRPGGDVRVKFSEAALQRIEMYSKGRPGLVRELCGQAAALPSTRLTEHVAVDALTETAERLGMSRVTGFSAEPVARVERAREHRSRRHGPRWAVPAIVAAAVAIVFLYIALYVGLSGVGARVIATSSAWMARFVPAADRPPADVARSRPAETRRETGVTTARARAAVPPPVPPASPQTREPSAGEKTQRSMAEPSAGQVAALMAGAREGDIGELTRLVAGGVSPNVRDATGYTPLMTAVVNDRIPAARVLLDRGADINARTRGGITPLMLSVINERPNAVKLLLERGADVNAQSGAGWTALTFAVWKGDAGLVHMLLTHGAKPNVTDKQGWKPLDYAGPNLAPADGGPDPAPAPSLGSPR